jgi:hypothetical protein
MDVQVGVKHAVAVRFLFRFFLRWVRPRLATADQRLAVVPGPPPALATADQRLARVPGPILSRRRGAAGTLRRGALPTLFSREHRGVAAPALVMGKNA